jgi:cell division protein FtsI (penicillin-binding protein 3)
MKPYLVNRIVRDGIPYREFQPTVLEENFCKPSTVKAARSSMEMVITEGTGKPAFKDMPFAVAGKTGTAHVADGNIKYYDMVYQASFVGYFPANDPVYTCIVVVRTKLMLLSLWWSNSSAGFREIAIKLYAMYIEKKTLPSNQAVKDSLNYFYAGKNSDIKMFLNIECGYSDSVRQSEWGNVIADNYQPVINEINVRKAIMPNIKGMGLKDVIYLLENMGLKVKANGQGKVMVQSIQAGSALTKGMTVYVELG